MGAGTARIVHMTLNIDIEWVDPVADVHGMRRFGQLVGQLVGNGRVVHTARARAGLQPISPGRELAS
ncbi:MAG: hypothetical protein Q7S35_08040 [Candidatus Limnocylindrales bacterium]|nr:hypothetical protein [Candidatus Limnocylindrales bacterium]